MRCLFLLLVVLGGCSSAPPPPPPPTRPPVLLVPVVEKATEGSARYAADWSFDIRAEDHFSVHVHVIPAGQMVPMHRHPENWELTFVAGGAAEWTGAARIDGALDTWTRSLSPGEAVIAPVGAAHQVRNRGPGVLTAVVVHQPEFGQNWYLPTDEVADPAQSGVFEGPSAPNAPTGWAVSWESLGEHAGDRDHILLVAAGEGTLRFEDTTLPLRPGHVASIPGGLHHTVSGDSGFRAVSLLVPASTRNP